MSDEFKENIFFKIQKKFKKIEKTDKIPTNKIIDKIDKTGRK